MKSKPSELQILKIEELPLKLNIGGLLNKENSYVTFNQLMKSDQEISYVFMMDDDLPEASCLFNFCCYFGIKLFKLSEEDALDIKNNISYARLISVLKNSDLESYIIDKIKNSNIETEILKLKII